MSNTDKTGGRDINYWRRRMGLKEDGNVGVGSTSGNVGLHKFTPKTLLILSRNVPIELLTISSLNLPQDCS